MKQMFCKLLALFFLIGFGYSSFSQVRFTKFYHKNGVLKGEGNLKDGVKDGVWKFYNKDAIQISRIVYTDGKHKKLTLYRSNGSIKKEVIDYSDLGYGLCHIYEDDFLKNRFWVSYKGNGKFDTETSYLSSKTGSTLSWSKSKELKSWRYKVITKQKENFREILPAFEFYGSNQIRSIKYKGIGFYFTDKGEFKNYIGPLDDTHDFYNCTFQTYDGKIHITKDKKVVEKDIDIKSFIGLVSVNIKDGIPQGDWKINYPNGKTFMKLSFDDGFLNGAGEIYYSNGKPKAKFNFENDLLNGKFKTWYKDGKPFQDGEFTNGKMTGPWKIYNPNASLLKAFTIYENAFDGNYVQYSAQGEILEEKNYVKSKINGESIKYNRDGSLKEVNTYYLGKKVKSIQYYKGVASEIEEVKSFRFRHHSNGKLRSISYGDDLNSMGFFLDTAEHVTSFSYSCNRNNIFKLTGSYKADTLHKFAYKIAGEEVNMKPHQFIQAWPKNYITMSGDSLNGKRTGAWVFYHPNGNVWAQGNYDKDLLNGKWEIFNLKETKIAEQHYNQGLRHGTYQVWDENGLSYLEENYEMGELDDKRVEYFPGTKQIKTTSTYKNGKLTGQKINYLENGAISKETNYKDGKRDGLVNNFHEKDGYLVSSIMYKNDDKDGPLRKFDANQMLLSEVNYKKDKKHGDAIQFDGSGNVTSKKKYYYGILLDEEELSEQCYCEAGENSLSRDGRYFPSIKNIANWSDILFYLDGKIAVTKALYDNTFYAGINTQPYYASLNLISRQELVFENFDHLGLAFVLNPCLKNDEFSSIPLEVSYDYPIGRLMDEEYDPQSFKGLPIDYFKIALKVNAFTMRDMYSAYYRLLTEQLNTYDEYRIVKKMHEDFKAYGIEINYEWASYEIEELIAETAPKRSEFYTMIFETYFNVETLDREYFREEYAKFSKAFNSFFGYKGQYKSIRQIDALFEKVLQFNLGNKKLGIDFPLELLSPITPSNLPHATGKSRLLMTLSHFTYNLNDGIQLTKPHDFCFTPSKFTGTDLSISIDSARLEFKYRDHWFSVPPPPTKSAKFLKSHEIDTESGIYVPYASGNWLDKNSKSEFEVTYEALKLEGVLIAGEISLKKSADWSPLIQNNFAKQFSVFEISENNDDIIRGMFIMK